MKTLIPRLIKPSKLDSSGRDPDGALRSVGNTSYKRGLVGAYIDSSDINKYCNEMLTIYYMLTRRVSCYRFSLHPAFTVK